MEIMTNEEVKEVTTEVVTGGSNTIVKAAAGIGIAGLAGFGIYKLVKHISAKRKAKKEQLEASKAVYPDFNENEIDDEEDVEDED
jgi:hypothetical protein